MPPAQQRFEAADPVGGDVHQRLIVQFEFAVGESAAQIELHVAALLRLPVHLPLEETMNAAAVRLRPVQRHVGVAHQFLAGLAVAGRKRNPDAGADHDLDAVDVVTGAQYLDQPGREIARLVRGDVGGQNDRELVAAEPGDEIVAANLRPQPVGHQPQQAIADRVAEGIVDVLEQVEIDA